MSTLQEDNARRRANRAYYKSRSRCTHCGVQDAFTLGGRAMCSVCAEKYASKNRAYRNQDEAHKKRAVEYASKRQVRLRESGLCITCGKPTNSSFSRCGKCLAKRRNAAKEKRIERGVNFPRGDNGYCWICNKRFAITGYRTCEICRQKKISELRLDTPVAKAGRGKNVK